MIDFIRIRYSDKIELEEYVLKSPLFEQTFRKTKIHSNVKSYPIQTELYGMDLIIRNQSAEVCGSIHKYWNIMQNNLNQNDNDFTYSNLVSTIDNLSIKVLGSNIESISRLEAGINIEIDESPSNLIKNNILMFKEAPFSRIDRFNGSGFMKRFVGVEFDIKIYDKGKQYRLDKQILRLEIVIKGKRTLRRLGIYNLESLKIKRIYRKLFVEILKKLELLVILDDFSKINKLDKAKLYKYTNFVYWDYHISKTSYAYKSKVKKEFRLLVKKNDLLKTKHVIKKKLVEQFIYLINN